MFDGEKAMRLQKFLSKAGVASRRKSEELIQKGLIKVNGQTISQLGLNINPDSDIIFYSGKRLSLQKNIYIMLNKPVGFITTMKEQFNRPSILDLIKLNEKIFPVGRLDCNSSGLLLLTNDGDLAYKLTHPKHDIFKTYHAKIKGVPDQNQLKNFRHGLVIENKKTKTAHIKILNVSGKNCTVEIKISEGRNRQIRKMCEKINHPVINLKRVAIGDLKLDVGASKYRFLTEDEVCYLKSI